MKYSAILLLSFCFLISCNNKEKKTQAEHSRAIKEQAEKMKQALVSKNYNTLPDYTYPKIIKMMGGKEKMVALIEEQFKGLAAEGFAIVNIKTGEPSAIINAGKELQCTLPETVEMTTPEGKIATNSTLIAISTDDGEHWYFVDTSDNDMEAMKKILPNLSEKLVITRKEPPVMIK